MTEEKETEETANQETSPQQEETLSPLETLEASLKEEKDKNLRLLAEMENLRKRLHKEKLDMNRFAVENVLLEVLMPLDNFENALGFTDNMNEETKNWAMGFKMILTQFKEILSNHNVKPIVSLGKQFDPHLHEAVEVEETEEHPEGEITHEFLKGYKCGDRTIRPARVRVAKPPKQVKEENNQKEEA